MPNLLSAGGQGVVGSNPAVPTARGFPQVSLWKPSFHVLARSTRSSTPLLDSLTRRVWNMPLLDLNKITAGLAPTWAAYLRDWDRSRPSPVRRGPRRIGRAAHNGGTAGAVEAFEVLVACQDVPGADHRLWRNPVHVSGHV